MTDAPPARTYTIMHTEASRGWGGQEHRILVEAQTMTQRGHRVLIAASPQGELLPRARRSGLPVFPLAFGGRGNLAALVKLRRLLAQEQVDILNTHSSLDSWIGALAILGRRRRTKLVRTRHLSTPIRTSLPTRWLYQQADATITTGTAIKAIIQQRAQVPAEAVFSIPTGVSLERFSPPAAVERHRLPCRWPAGMPVIGSVAVLRSWKGHLYLVEALHRLRQEGLQAGLVLVGEGPYREVIEPKIAALDLQEWVCLTGYQDDVPPWLALMDIVVLASYANEGVPQSLLQAMAMGKPVVGTDCGGIPEIVQPGVNGLLVPPRDSEALAAALAHLLSRPETRQQFGAAGRRLVESCYSLEQMARALEGVYDRLWSGRQRQGAFRGR